LSTGKVFREKKFYFFDITLHLIITWHYFCISGPGSKEKLFAFVFLDNNVIDIFVESRIILFWLLHLISNQAFKSS